MLPMREKYGEMFSAITDTAKSIGRSLGPRRSPKAVDTSQYGGLAGTVKRNLPRNISTSIKDIGNVSVHPGGKTRYEAVHPGIDIANVTGTPIPSFTGGKVSQIVTGKKWKDPGYGNYIIVVDQQGNKHRYSHLSASYVKIGDPVYRGMPIGAMGKSGQTYSSHAGGDPSHLDFRSRDPRGAYIDPMQFVNAYQKIMR